MLRVLVYKKKYNFPIAEKKNSENTKVGHSSYRTKPNLFVMRKIKMVLIYSGEPTNKSFKIKAATHSLYIAEPLFFISPTVVVGRCTKQKSYTTGFRQRQISQERAHRASTSVRKLANEPQSIHRNSRVRAA